LNDVIVLHDFDGSLYFKGLERVVAVKYYNIQPFRFLMRDIFKLKKIQKNTFVSLMFLFFLFFKKDNIVIIGTAPFNLRFLVYVSILSFRNRVFLHTSWPFWNESPPVSYHCLFFNVIKKLWIYYLPHLSGIIAVTEATKTSVLSFLNKQSCTVPYDITQIYHVVDIEPIESNTFENKWNDNVDITFVGRLETEKGIEDFLLLSELINPKASFTYHVLGKGSCIKQLEKWDEENRHSYYGFVSDRRKLKDILQKTNVLILPSKRLPDWEELFGLVIVEAMSQGVIVLTTDHVGPTEIITDGKDSFYFDEQEFVEKSKLICEDILINFSKYKLIGKNAIGKSQKFNMDKIGQEWKKFLKDNKVDII
jgi:glycosyltransferase involved in cell wall biosynthesis